MSFSFRLPEEDPICECKYDDVHDRMDREDCAFHCDIIEDAKPANALPAPRKPPLSIATPTRILKCASGDRIDR
jgi:hypothetical protein